MKQQLLYIQIIISISTITWFDFVNCNLVKSLEKTIIRKILMPTLSLTTPLYNDQIISNSNLFLKAEAFDFSKKTTTSDSLEQYLIRDISFPSVKKTMSLTQGFAINKGITPAQGGGDRTGTYTWPGGIELAQTILDRRVVDVRNKRIIDLGTGTGC